MVRLEGSLCSDPCAPSVERRARIPALSDGQQHLEGEALTDAISAAIVALYGQFYGHDRTTASTYINDNIVVCVLEDILTSGESVLVAGGERREVIDARVAFQEGTEDEFAAAIQRLSGRRVVAFMSANQTEPGIACELFFLEPKRPGGLPEAQAPETQAPDSVAEPRSPEREP